MPAPTRGVAGLDAAVEAALAAAEAAGVPRERIVLAVSDVVSEENTTYQTHVGRTEDSSMALMLEYIARDLTTEAHRQSMALYGAERCPECGSPRWAPRGANRESRPGERPGIYRDVWDECMDCGARGPDR